MVVGNLKSIGAVFTSSTYGQTEGSQVRHKLTHSQIKPARGALTVIAFDPSYKKRRKTKNKKVF